MVILKGKQLLVKVILGFLLSGILVFSNLPLAYCGLEDKTVRYIHMSASGKTVTKVVPFTDDEGNANFNVLGDRCQKGTTIEPWVKINSELAEKVANNLIYIAVVDEGFGELVTYYCPHPLVKETCIRKDEILPIFI